MPPSLRRTPTRPRRRASVVLACLLGVLALLLGVAGCAGEDLVKTAGKRTTVPPQPGSGGTGPVPEGPVNEPALTADKLREVEACELLKGEAVTQLGTPAEPSGTGPDTCSVTVTDPGAKEIRVSITMGETFYGGVQQATGGLDGLPLNETRQDQSCTDKVLTSEEPAVGVSVQVTYADGEPCGAGRKVLSKIIQQLKTDPPKADTSGGSVVKLDPCKVIPKATLDKVLGEGQTTSSFNLHGCISSGTLGSGTLSLNFTFAYPPYEGSNSKEVKLSSKVTALQTYYDPKNEQCSVEWAHKEYSSTSSMDGESVRVDYSNYGGDGKALDACKKAVEVAKVVVGKLPKA